MPALGTGVGDLPVKMVAHIMVEEAARHAALKGQPSLIQFVLFSSDSKAVFERAISDRAEKHMR